MGKKIILAFLLVFCFTLVSAYSTHQQETDFEYSFTSNNATQCNLTTGNTPEGLVTINLIADKSGQTFTLTLLSSNFTELGDYCYNLVCTDGISYETGSKCITVTYTGKSLELPQTIMYIIVFIFLVGLLGYIIYLYPKLPNHSKNEDGYVISANSLAYLRPIAIGFMWILLLSITYIIANISIAYITAGFLGKFIFGIWQVMMYGNLIIVPLWFIYLINDAFRTAKLKEFIERGGHSFG